MTPIQYIFEVIKKCTVATLDPESCEVTIKLKIKDGQIVKTNVSVVRGVDNEHQYKRMGGNEKIY